jgi:hypothetical protein
MMTPLEGERVVFVAHFERGFHHMLATAIMTLSAFAAFYEGYAGIESFVVAWAKYFQLRKQSVQEPKDKDKNAPDAGKDAVRRRHYYVSERLRVSQNHSTRVSEEVAQVFLLCEESDQD